MKSDVGGVPTGKREVRSGPTPTMSIAIAWRSESDKLEGLLEWVLSSVGNQGLEVIVAHSDQSAASVLRERFPDVAFFHLPEDSSYGQLRMAAMAAAGGDIVGIADDRRPPDAGWLAGLTAGLPLDPERRDCDSAGNE